MKTLLEYIDIGKIPFVVTAIILAATGQISWWVVLLFALYSFELRLKP